MFFTPTTTFVLAALPLLAASTPLANRNGGSGSGSGGNCSTGTLQCCDSVQKASNSGITVLLGLLGVVLQDVDVLVGLVCSPITVIGVGGGSSCSANTVCCQNNAYGGLVSIGCVPVTL
ncbi:fungal hydrophobin-domain-containing protein [Trametes gibbosa]|nr:fungal hydrophobin-domain-containing protein [Trametes gibbosa]